MKKTLFLFFLLTLAMNFQGQNSRSYRQLIDLNDVPKKVRDEFKLRYPGSFVKMWYVTSISYWYEDYGPSYYNGWYQQRRTVVVYSFDQPQNYEVEFMYNGENSRAIFNRYGVWFETRTMVAELPGEIEQALEGSDFGTWNWSDYKERIEAPGMAGSVYRLNVTQKHLSHIIRINDDGKIVQIKTE